MWIDGEGWVVLDGGFEIDVAFVYEPDVVLCCVVKCLGVFSGDGVGVCGVHAEVELCVVVYLLCGVGDGELVGMDGVELMCFSSPD